MHVRNGLGFMALALAVLLSSVRAADPPAAPQPGPRAAEFARLFGQWKSLLADLSAMKIEYRKADEKQRAELKDKWNRLIEKGSVMRDRALGGSRTGIHRGAECRPEHHQSAGGSSA